MLERLDYTIRSVRTPTLLYFDKLFVDCSIYCVAAVDGGRHTGLVVVNVAWTVSWAEDGYYLSYN